VFLEEPVTVKSPAPPLTVEGFEVEAPGATVQLLAKVIPFGHKVTVVVVPGATAPVEPANS